MCMWDGCTELGMFDHIVVAFVIFLDLPSFCLLGMARTNPVCDIDAVHGWLFYVQETLWPPVHP